MILINLLPPEFRKTSSGSLSGLVRGKWVKSSFLFFLALTLIFYAQYLLSSKTLTGLEKKWPGLQLKTKHVTEIRAQLESIDKPEKNFLENYAAMSFKTISILSATSELLPEGTWLIELRTSRAIKDNTFLLKGLSVSGRQHSSIQDIEKYLRGLKERFPQNTSLVLTTSRQEKEKTELTLFTSVFKWQT